jgi:hypothetical protein
MPTVMGPVVSFYFFLLLTEDLNMSSGWMWIVSGNIQLQTYGQNG